MNLVTRPLAARRSGRRGPRRGSRLVLASAAFALSLMLAACSSGGPSLSGTTSTTGRGSAVAPRSTTTSVTVPPFVEARNARQDVTPGACTDDGDKGWSFTGKVVNPADKPQGYSIAVDFIAVPGDTVQATQVIEVPAVAPHKSAKWSATGAAPGHKNVTCVIRQALTTS